MPGNRRAFAMLNSDPRVAEYLGTASSQTESDALADRLDVCFEQRGFGGWAVEVRHGRARAVLSWAFETLGVREVVSFTVPENARSRRAMAKLGMTHHLADDFDHPLLPPSNRLPRHVLYRATHLTVRCV
jgi:RimJ/RimL family protein N-acetyltransferase